VARPRQLEEWGKIPSRTPDGAVDFGGGFMSKRKYVAVAVGAIALLVAGGLFASNMGFKLNFVLQGPDGCTGPLGAAPCVDGQSVTGEQQIALPYHQQTSLVNASDLRVDVGAPFASVTKFLKATGGVQGYTGAAAIDCNPATLGNCDFALVPGEGYKLQVSSDLQYIIVGSHDPGLVIDLLTAAPGISANGETLFAYAYHQTASTASELLVELGGTASVSSISKFLRYNNAPQGYTGASVVDCNPATLGNCDFDLVPGESYKIQTNVDIAYTPSHY
jgi:hypothetical protein